MKKKLIAIFILLNSTQIFAQYLKEHMSLLTSENPFTEVICNMAIYVKKDTILPNFKFKSQISFNRKEKVANFKFSSTYGQVFYDDNWQERGMIETNSDGLTKKWTINYDSRKRVSSVKCFERKTEESKEDFLSIQDTFFYVKKNEIYLKKRTNFYENGESEDIYTKYSIKKSNFGLTREEITYESKSNAKNFKLIVKREIKYSLFGKHIKKETIYFPQYKLPEVRVYDYKKGVLIRKKVTRDKNNYVTLYEFEKGLIQRKLHLYGEEIEEWKYTYKIE